MKIHSIPGKFEVNWLDDVKAILDKVTNYSISLEEFKEAVLDKGLNHSIANGGIAWIVDSSAAEGIFNAEIQNFIGSDVFPAFAKNGIKYFITINSKTNILTSMTVKTFQSKTKPHGLKLVEVNTVEDAKNWLKQNS